MAEENKNEKKRSRGGRLLALMLTSPVNTLFILALAYYAFQIYVLNNSPLLNKAIMLGIACLWILWFAAKNLIKLLLLLILAGTAVYGYYGYATRDARKCEENGGVWNKESKTCEEKNRLAARNSETGRTISEKISYRRVLESAIPCSRAKMVLPVLFLKRCLSL